MDNVPGPRGERTGEATPQAPLRHGELGPKTQGGTSLLQGSQDPSKFVDPGALDQGACAVGTHQREELFGLESSRIDKLSLLTRPDDFAEPPDVIIVPMGCDNLFDG